MRTKIAIVCLMIAILAVGAVDMGVAVPVEKAFQFSGWGYYKAIDNQGRTYFAGYDSGYLYTCSNAKALPNDQVALVLNDSNPWIVITSANPLKLAEGYQLAIKSIDVNKAYIELSKSGEVVDLKVVQPSIDNAKMSDQTYYYKTSLGNTTDIIKIAVHFKNAFRGADTNIATVDGVFQISDTVTPLNPQNSLSPETTKSIEIFNNWNTGGVDNNPSCIPSFTVSGPYMITYADTYHWNYGQGTKEGGTITLRRNDGIMYGPWQVETKPGQGSVPNAWWIAHPNETIPAGTYTIIDSDSSTWSQNSGSNGCGFSKVEGNPFRTTAATISQIRKPSVNGSTNVTQAPSPGPRGSESTPVMIGSDQITLPDRSSLINTSDWGEVPANQVIVMLKEGKGRTDADRLASSLGGQVVGFFNYINLYQIKTSGTTEAELKASVAKAKQDPDVELAFPNQQSYPDVTVQGIQCSPLDDPVYSEGGRGKDYEMIGVQRAWDLIRVSGLPLSDVHVGVVDDGLYKGNDEFNGKVKIDTSEQNSELIGAEGQFGSHGTEVMNIIAADPGNGGITGIASQPLGDKLEVSMINNNAPPYGNNFKSGPDPNDPTKMVSVHGKTYSLGDLLAINKSINDGATIISCSWGDSEAYPPIAAACKKFFEKMANDHPDVLFVCSAGNDGKALDGSQRFPSGLALPNMITVGNVMNDGTNTARSNMASKNFEVTLAAPGQESVHGFDNKGGIENSFGGTSMATPQVTSAAALIRALNPQLTAGQIKDILVQNARTSVDIDGNKVPAPPELGGGILAIDQAVFKVINDQRKKLNLTLFKDIDSALGLARIDLAAENDPASPNDWKVTANVLGVGANGADVTLDLQGEGAVGGNKRQHLTNSGSLTWDITLKDTATVVVKRLDTNGCSSAYLSSGPAEQKNEIQTVREYDKDGNLLWEVEGYRYDGDQKYNVLNRSGELRDPNAFMLNFLSGLLMDNPARDRIPICIINDGYKLVLHGKFKSWINTGGGVWENPVIEGEYKNGLKQGQWVYRYRSEMGNIYAVKAAEGEYLEGLKEGHWIYYDSGICRNMVSEEGDYLNGIKQENTWKSINYVAGPQGECVPGKIDASGISHLTE